MRHAKAGSQESEARMFRTEEAKMKSTRSFLQILLATLREIFDENAYQRFLERTGQGVCVQSYRQFQQEREAGVATRPRCC